MPANSGCSVVIPVCWKKEINGWYVVSTNINWRGSPLKEMRSREARIVWRSVRPATKMLNEHPFEPIEVERTYCFQYQ